MNKITSFTLLIVIVFVFQTSFLSALIATIDNPRMIMYKNLTSGSTLSFERSIVLRNENPYSVDISLSPDSRLKPYLTLDEENFSLSVNQTKEVFYTLKFNKAGEYGGDIIITFREQETDLHLSLAQSIVIHITEVKRDRNKDILIGFLVILSILIIVVLISIVKYRKGRRKR